MKKISVIVPIYNTEKYLERCIESIQRQTYTNLEIILIDDGSSDKSLEICYKYASKDRRIKVLYQANSGVSNARNTGIDNSTGEYIGFVDSDDCIEENMYENLMLYASDKTMPICTYNMVDEKKKVIAKKDTKGIEKELNVGDFFLLCENILLNSPVNKLYEAQIIRDNNIRFDTSLSLGEDFLFVLQYIEYIKKFYILEEALYNYLVIERDSLSQIYRKDFYEIQRKIIFRIKELLQKDMSCFETYKEKFYTFALDLYLQALNNTFSSKGGEKIQYKVKRNNEIMKDPFFEECFINADVSNLNKCYVKLLKKKKYEYIWVYTTVIQWIKRRKQRK